MPRAGPLAARVLLDGGRGRVVSVHRRALNLLFEDRTLVGVLPSGRPVHPWSLATPVVPREVSIGMPFSAGAGIVEIGDHRLGLVGLEVIDLELRERPVEAPSASCREELLVAGGDLLAARPFEADLAAAEAAYRQRGDVAALAAVLGVGEGLTPSGDDMLMGALAGLDLLREADTACRMRRSALVADLAPRVREATTRLSAQLLLAAADGLYPEPLLHLLEALVRGAGVAAAVPPVLAQGHRSGRDTLRGLLLVLEGAG